MAISLSSGVRQSLQSLQSTALQAQGAQTRLATGKRVNSAVDNPVNFFTAASLNNRADDLKGLQDGISNSIQTIKSASSGIEGITKLVKSAQAAITQARNSSDASVRAASQTQYTELLSQIDDLAEDSGFNGINLLATDQLKTAFNEKTGTEKNELIIDGGLPGADPATDPNVAVTASSLGIDDAATAFVPDDVATTDENEANAALDTAADSLKGALTTLTSLSSKLGANLAVVQARQEFTSAMVDNLRIGADNLTNADSNEEGASLLALQTRQQLSQTALSLSSQADQSVLRLF